MAKKLENMTMDERYAYFEKKREKEKADRQKIIDNLPIEMVNSVIDLINAAEPVVETALHEGGVRYLSIYDMQKLQDELYMARKQFNIER